VTSDLPEPESYWLVSAPAPAETDVEERHTALAAWAGMQLGLPRITYRWSAQDDHLPEGPGRGRGALRRRPPACGRRPPADLAPGEAATTTVGTRLAAVRRDSDGPAVTPLERLPLDAEEPA
jgi:hypothetical protein